MLDHKRLLVPAMTTATLLVVLARAVRRSNGTKGVEKGPTVERKASDPVANASASRFPACNDFDVVRWIPAVGPTMALVLVIGVYLIYAAVL